ncbi:hypothetical protein U1Q18_033015, partial [Sarracenia purpurea var. burkii]
EREKKKIRERKREEGYYLQRRRRWDGAGGVRRAVVTRWCARGDAGVRRRKVSGAVVCCVACGRVSRRRTVLNEGYERTKT